MEPITLGLIAFNIIMGVDSSKVEQKIDKIVDLFNPKEISKRKYNHDLTRAVLEACKESELEILKSFENSENSDFQKYIKTQIEDVKDEIRIINRRGNHRQELTYNDLIDMVTTGGKESGELHYLFDGREAYPELIKRFKEDFYSIAKIKFAYQIKKNNEIANIFIAEVVANTDRTINELFKILVGQYGGIHTDLSEIKNNTLDIKNDTTEIKNGIFEILSKMDTDNPKAISGHISQKSGFSLSDQYSNWIHVDQSREQQKEYVNSKKVKDFLCGKKCTWSLAFSDCIVHRKIVDDMIADAKDGGITIFVGAGGEGKSTALMQMCAGLYKEGYTVLYHIDGENFILPKDLPDNTVFAVDNPPGTIQFKSFIALAQQDDRTVILSSRSNEWNLLKDTLKITLGDITEKSMPQINSITEAEKFADCVKQYLDTTQTRDEITKLFMGNAYGFLYAAMLMLLYNENRLESIADSIVRELLEKEPLALKLLAYVVFSEHLGISFSQEQYSSVCKDLKLTPREAKDALALEVNRNGNAYVTRHNTISDLFFKLIFSEDGLLESQDMEKIRLQTFKYHLSGYSGKIGYEKKQFEENIRKLVKCINSYSKVEQGFLLDRIIDEFKSYFPFLVKIQNQIENTELKRYFLKQCFVREAFDSNLIAAIAKSEWQDGNIGSYYDGMYCARELYRKACMEYGSDGSVWFAWAQMEQELDGIGSYAEVNTARWIYNEACMNHEVDGKVWLAWAKTEQEMGGIGSCDEKNTARWIYNEACINHNADGQVWLAWANLEQQMGGMGSYETKNTARWIYNEACINHNIDGQVWLAWALMEQEKGNIGDYEEKNTARWIFKEACMNQNADGKVWLAWALMEQEKGEIGDYEEKNTARWIFKEACMKHNADGQVWLAWGKMEESNRVGSGEELYSARWIYETAIKTDGDFAPLYAPYAVMELHCNRPEVARRILRQSMRKSNFSLFYLTVLEIVYGNIGTGDQYSAINLLSKMEANIRKSDSVVIHLYECYKLLGNNDMAEKYGNLSSCWQGDEAEKERIKNYIDLCRKQFY